MLAQARNCPIAVDPTAGLAPDTPAARPRHLTPPAQQLHGAQLLTAGVLQDSLTREQIAAEAAADADSTWSVGEPIPEPTHWPRPPPDMDPEFVLSSVHLHDPEDPLPPELQPEGPISPDQILTPRRRSGASTSTATPPAQAVNSARARSRAPARDQQNTNMAGSALAPQAGRPAWEQASHPAAEPGHSQRSGGHTSGSLASAAAPKGRPPRKPRRVTAAASRFTASRSEPGPGQGPAEAGRQGSGAEQAQQPKGSQGAEEAGSRTQLQREQDWISMWDNEQLDGLLYSNPLAPEALADVRPEDLAEAELVALGRELERQQMHAQGRTPKVQEASLEDLIDRGAYKEVGPIIIVVLEDVTYHV